jgi:putative ABC transport system substrate-binding protein
MTLARLVAVVALTANILAAPPAVVAQQVEKVARIGFLEAGAATTNQHFLDAFRRGLTELGYTEGRNVVIEQRWADGRNDRFPALLAELIKLKVDVIVQASTPGAVAAKAATSTIPIVFVGVADPIGSGLVASLARPGGNLTGFTLGEDLGLDGKRLELLREAIPKVRRVAVLWNPTAQALESRVKALHTAGATLGLAMVPFEARQVGDFDTAFAAMKKTRVDAVLVMTDPLTLRHRKEIVGLAASTQIPAMYGFSEFARTGGLMAYSTQIPELFRRAALYVDKILKGASPADLPVEQPTTFELIINLKTARAFGLTIPPSLRLRADQVIE